MEEGTYTNRYPGHKSCGCDYDWGELQQAGETWKQVHLSTVISKRNTVKTLNISEYNLKGVKGKIHMMREVIILPFVTTIVRSIYNLMMHSKHVNAVVKPVMGYLDQITIARSYGILKPRRGKIDVCLRNHSAKQITLPKQTAVGEIIAANVILALLVPKPTEDISDKGKATAKTGICEGQKDLLDIIDLTGSRDWSMDEQKEALKLIAKYTSISTMSNMDLDKTSLVKHSIRLRDNTV